MLRPLSPTSRPAAAAIVSSPPARRVLARAQAVLLDWDGCVALGDRLQPAALRLIAQHLDRVVLVSNNTTHLPEHFSNLLAAEGLTVPPQRIILAGNETLAHAARLGASRVLLLGVGRMKAQALRLGLNLVRDHADLVILLRDNRFTYAKLERAAQAVRDGARLLVGNPDLTHPGPGGRLVPETGALLAALEACLDGRDAAAEVIGKPEPRLFRRACAVVGAVPEAAVMIGDNPSTDMAGALALGMAGVLVGSRSGLSLDELAA